MNTIEVLLKQANTPDSVGRIFPLEELTKVCNNINESELPPFGEFGIGKDSLITVENVSHTVVSARMDGDRLMATIKLLDTPMGKIAQKCKNDKLPIKGAMRSVGFVDEETKLVSDLQFITVDIFVFGGII